MDDIIDNMLKDVVRKEASVTTTPVNKNLLNISVPGAPRKSKSDIFENTQEFISDPIPKHRDHREYLALEQDYSHRPNVKGMDWAECPWAHPDDSLLYPSIGVNAKP